MTKANINVDTWYNTALYGGEWYKILTICLPQEVRIEGSEVCDGYGRTFRREADKAGHKCLAEQQKPVQDQQVQNSVMCVHGMV